MQHEIPLRTARSARPAKVIHFRMSPKGRVYPDYHCDSMMGPKDRSGNTFYWCPRIAFAGEEHWVVPVPGRRLAGRIFQWGSFYLWEDDQGLYVLRRGKRYPAAWVD